jgi:hypothetical protein
MMTGSPYRSFSSQLGTILSFRIIPWKMSSTRKNFGITFYQWKRLELLFVSCFSLGTATRLKSKSWPKLNLAGLPQLLFIQPATAADDIQPAAAFDDIQPAAAFDDIQHAANLNNIRPATAFDYIQPAAIAGIDEPI